MAIERDRVERVLPSLPVAPVAMPPNNNESVSTALSLGGDMAALASLTGSKEQRIKRRSEVQEKAL